MSYRAIGERLRRSLAGFKISLGLSLLGTVVEALVVLFTYNIILLTDLAHWLIDTVLEALFIVSVNHASKSYKKFPLGTLVLESTLVTTATLTMVAIYGYFFVDYFLKYEEAGLSGSYHPALAGVTLLGALLTAVVMYVQKKKYEELGLEIIRVDYIHGIVDTAAAALSSTGLVVVSLTHNKGYEALFTVLLSLFVFHSALQVLSDTFKTVTGKNTAPEIRARLFERLVKELGNAELLNVDARKVGSFYVVFVQIAVNSGITVEEAFKIRRRVADLIREECDLVYHVDISIVPKRKRYRRR